VLTPARVIFAQLTMSVLRSTVEWLERIVWIFSMIVCIYLALCTIYHTTAIDNLIVLVSISYIALIIGCITYLSFAACIFIMLFDMGYDARLFRYTLSEHRQLKGTERSAKYMPTRSEEEIKEDRSVFNMYSYASAVSLA
jgi:hypothetical protein